MSQEAKIELKGLSYYGENSSRTNTSDKVTNLYLDDNGYFRGRGGLSLITTSGATLPSAVIDGSFYWASRDITMIVCGGKLYFIDGNNAVTLVGTGLETNERASFCIVRTSAGIESLAVANGGDIFVWDPVNNTFTNTYTTDNDAPRGVKKIVFLNGYLIALPTGSNKFYFSIVGDPEDWSALDFASAEANADLIENMLVKGFYLYLFGTETVETWYNDGVSPFIRLDGGVIENGTASPFSVTKVEDFLLFLDNKRRICVVEGQANYKVLSDSIGKYLQLLDSVEDAYGYQIIHQGRVFYALTFPTASRTDWDGSGQTGITFVLDIKNLQIFEWANWNTDNAEFGKFPINCQAYCSLQQRQILGSKNADGKLFVLDETVYQDDSDTLKVMWRSGYIDFGKLKKKRIRRMQWRATSGTSITSTEFLFNKRFDGNSTWKLTTPLTLQVGNSALNQFTVNNNNVGIARIFQFEISSTSNSPFCIGDMSFDIDLMTT